MNIVVLAPHPDDESIGCGGTLRLHVERGDRVVVAFLTSGELGLENLPPNEARRIREAEAAAAAAILGIAATEFLRRGDWNLGAEQDVAAAQLAPLLRQEAPAIIYLPHAGEWHPDHRATLPVALAALRESAIPTPELRLYELWTPLGVYDEVEDITATMAVKLRAVRAYRSQLGAFRYDHAVRGLAAYRGALAAKCRYAEVFDNVELPEPGAA